MYRKFKERNWEFLGNYKEISFILKKKKSQREH